MSPKIVSIDNVSGTVTVRAEEFRIGFMLLGGKLSLTSKADESANRMGPEGIWIPEHIMTSARRMAYAALSGRLNNQTTRDQQLVLL